MTPHRNGTWTDWNTHDPGIAILETIAYSVSDLAIDLRRRLLAGKCGWRCALFIAVCAGGAVVLVQRRITELNRRKPMRAERVKHSS